MRVLKMALWTDLDIPCSLLIPLPSLLDKSPPLQGLILHCSLLYYLAVQTLSVRVAT